MTPWCADRLIQQRTDELTAAHRQPGPRRQRAGRLSVWCGYRMIDMGSRLLRPALVAGARPA